jgi:Uma2 family endonuclease
MNPLLAPDKKLRIDFSSAGMLLTPEEFDAIEDYDGEYRYELIRGVLVVNPIPAEGEVDPNEELGRLLRNYGEQHPHGAALDSTLPERYVRTTKSRRRADRVIWAGLGRVPNPKRDAPQIAVEFVSRSRRDRQRDYIDKRREYRKTGVLEYWVIDRFHRQMTVYLTTPGTRRIIVVGENDVYRTDLLPGFELSLARLFAFADRWTD